METGQPSKLIAQHRNPGRARTSPAVGQAPYQDQSGRSHSDLSMWPPHAGDSEQIGPFCVPSLDRADTATTVQNGGSSSTLLGWVWLPGPAVLSRHDC